MVNVKGLKAYLLNKEYVETVPIQTIDSSEYLLHHPDVKETDSFLKVHVPELEFEIDFVNDESNRAKIMQKGRENLISFIKRKIFEKSDQEIGYIYRQVYKNSEQCGLLFCVSDKDYVEGKILPHEQTLEERVCRLQSGTNSLGIYNSFPLAFCDQDDKIEDIISKTIKTKPLIYKVQNDVENYLYALDENATSMVIEIFKKYDQIYIADGHHRFESYSKEVAKLSSHKDRNLIEDFDYYPVLIYPKLHLNTFSYHRLVKNIYYDSADDILKKSGEYFDIEKLKLPEDIDSVQYKESLSNAMDTKIRGQILVYFKLTDEWYKFKLPNHETDDPVENLDISYMSKNLLANVLGITDLKSSKNIEYLPETKGDTFELQKICKSNDSATILIICPKIGLDEVKSVADTKKCMPPKSTFIYPKPLIGLLFKAFENLE